MAAHQSTSWFIGALKIIQISKIYKTCKKFFIEINKKAIIPLGSKHRLSNPGSIKLELIQVKSCTYLDKDDNIRFEDIYDRRTNIN